jgi:hypothetical protein
MANISHHEILYFLTKKNYFPAKVFLALLYALFDRELSFLIKSQE